MATPPWLPYPWLQPLSYPGQRQPHDVERVVEQLDVTNSPRYRWESGLTYCNIFAWDVACGMGVTLPHWVDSEGNPVAAGRGRELAVHGMMEWLREHGLRFGWLQGTEMAAHAYALKGGLALPFWRGRFSPADGRLLENGHVAVALPSPTGAELRIANVGRTNFTRGTLRQGFGTRAPIEFWLHH